MKLKKGSAEAKAYMAKIRAKKSTKKVGAVAKTKIGSNKTYAVIKYNTTYMDRYTVDVIEFNKYNLRKNSDYKNTTLYGIYNSLKEANKVADNIYNVLNKGIKKIGAVAKKVGSTLKLKANEKRLGATPKDVKTRSKSYHKDTKSHNVNIRVMSGVNKTNNITNKIKTSLEWIEFYTEQLNWWKNFKPKEVWEKKGKSDSIKFYTKSLTNEKKHLSSIKKTI